MSIFSVEGISVAGLETCICLPSFKVAFDFGRCPQKLVKYKTVLLTHGHIDHVGGLPSHVSARALAGLTPTTVVLHPKLIQPVKALLSCHAELGSCDMPCEFIPLEEGQEALLTPQLKVRSFTTCHPVLSQGYVLYSVKSKLKASLRGLPSAYIAAMVKGGQDVNERSDTPEVAFTGDTTMDWVKLPGSDDALKARLLIMECTYVDDKADPEKALANGHIHIHQLAEHAHRFKNEALLLTHFSARYSASHIIAALEKRLPSGLRERCTPLLTGFPLGGPNNTNSGSGSETED